VTKVLREYPPNIKELREKFHPRPGTIFAWDGVIFAPQGGEIPGHLIAHEETHFRQQRAVGGPENWWRQYIDDPQFRLEQEIEAYRAQYAVAEQMERPVRRRLLASICRDLASAMYGSLISKEEARRLITSSP